MHKTLESLRILFGKSQNADDQEQETTGNTDNTPNKGCCCNCEDCGLVFTRLITCRRINPNNRRGMLFSIQDRLHITWRSALDTLSPMFVLPVVIGIAAINAYTATVMFLSCIGFIGYAYYYVQRRQSRTRFFYMWMFWSLVYMILLFRITVPMYVMLFEEIGVFLMLTTVALSLLHCTKQRAALNQVVQSSVAEDELLYMTEAAADEEEDTAEQTTLLLEHNLEDSTLSDEVRHHDRPKNCPNCRKYVPSRTSHCSVCAACIMRRDHHSYWLDCCIGEWNHRYYLAGLFFAELALLVGAYLTLTAVCHPFLIVRLFGVPLMLPDDCSDVFEQYEFGISFVIASYALVIATYILVTLLRQIYMILRARGCTRI